MNLVLRARIGRRLVILLCIAVTFFSAGRTAAKSPISLEALRRDGYGSVELVNDGQNRLYLPAEINGKKIRLLLDTGWGSPGIALGVDPSELHIVLKKGVQMAITTNGVRIAERHGVAQSVVIGNVRIQNTRIYFGRYSDLGFIGHGFLKKCGAIIDLTNLRLYLRPPGVGRGVNLGPALTSIGLAEAPFFSADGSFILNVEVNGVPAQMALDTGAQISVLDARFAKVASAKGWNRRNVYQGDAAGVLSPADFAGTKTFKIGGIPIRTPTVFLSRLAGYDLSRGKMVGVLGLDVIGLNWGIIDFSQQKFYFAKAK